MVSHREPRLDHFKRLETGQWLGTAVLGRGVVVVLGSELDIAEVYLGVVFHEGKRPA